MSKTDKVPAPGLHVCVCVCAHAHAWGHQCLEYVLIGSHYSGEAHSGSRMNRFSCQSQTIKAGKILQNNLCHHPILASQMRKLRPKEGKPPEPPAPRYLPPAGHWLKAATAQGPRLRLLWEGLRAGRAVMGGAGSRYQVSGQKKLDQASLARGFMDSLGPKP